MMPAPMFGRVAAVLAPLVTFLVTFLVAQQLPMLTRALGQSVPPTQVVRRELRIGAPGVPSALDPGAALEGTSPLIARQVFDTLVAWREGSTEIEPALATRWNASRDGLVWSFTLREGVKFHDGSPLTAHEVAGSFERQLKPEAQGANRTWPALLRGALRGRSRHPGFASDIWPSRPRRSPSLDARSARPSPRRSIRRFSARRSTGRPFRSSLSCLPVCGGVARAHRSSEGAGRR